MPFNSLAGVNGPGGVGDSDGANDFIYVYRGTGGAYTGGLPLESGQTLTSESNALVVGGITLRPAQSANIPTLSHNTASTVALSTGNTIDGFVITNSAGNGISGSAIGTTSIADIAVTVIGGTALTATTSGTLTVTGSANTLSSSSINGTALNVSNVTIGASGLTFQSISVNFGIGGIVLNNTGSAGGLTVTGTGFANSGGTIQGTLGRGASFISANNIKLNEMNFTDTGTVDLDPDNSGLSTGDNLSTNAAIHLETVTNVTLNDIDISGGAEQGINGNTVANFTLADSSISNVGNAVGEDNIHFFNMSGTSAITNTVLTKLGGEDGDSFNLQTQSGNLDLTISGGSATGPGGGSLLLSSGYEFGIRGTTVANINFQGASSTDNSGGIVADAFDNATMNLRVNGSTSRGNHAQLSVSASDNSNVDLEATGNTLSSLSGADLDAVHLIGSASDTGYKFDARIHGNTITVGSLPQAHGVFASNDGGGVMNVAVTDNTINYAGGEEAINVEQGYVGAATTRATITGNDIVLQFGANNPDNGILAISGVQTSGAGSFLDLNIGGFGALANTVNHSLVGTFTTGGDLHVSQRFGNNVNLDHYTGGATNTFAVVNYLTSRNIEFEEPTASIEGGRFFGGASPAFVTVSVSAASVAEDGGTNLRYTFTRNGSTAAPLVANFAITGTAAASDFGVTGATTYTAATDSALSLSCLAGRRRR